MITNFEFIYGFLKIKGFGPQKLKDYVIGHGLDLENCLSFLDIYLDDSKKIEFEEGVNEAREVYARCENLHISIITFFDSLFPTKLYECKEPCVLLYYYGDIHLLNKNGVAVIGTREPDNSFIQSSRSIISTITKEGYVVVSGLAKGSDTFGHEVCLDNGGYTIAVLPTPINDIYPKENVELARRIVKSDSLLISEYAPGVIISKFSFVERDRIQSMLSDGVFVIQSKDNGGTMNCVKRSLKDGKPVFALKGNNLKLITNYIDENEADVLLNKVNDFILKNKSNDK